VPGFFVNQDSRRLLSWLWSHCSSTMGIMQPCPDEAFEWIPAGCETLLPSTDPEWNGNFVSHLMPARFGAYAKILHSIEAMYANIDDLHSLTEREAEILKIPACAELRSFVENLRKQGQTPRVRWATLAHVIGVPFAPEICHEWFRRAMREAECWGRFLYGPGEGTLVMEEVSAMVSILRAFTGAQDCYFRFSPIAFAGADRSILFRGTLDELPTFLLKEKRPFTPEHWWPSDRSWCVCTDYDLHFTVVGGSKDLISAVLRDVTLETVEVKRHTRIDKYAPVPC